jgi:hypothetical protein
VIVNTFELQRAIRDDATLNGGEVAVLLVLTTYLPHAAPSVDAIALGCRMNAKSVRRILKRLDGRWLKRQLRPGRPSVYTFNPTTERPYHRETLPSRNQGSLDGRGSTTERPPKETNKRQPTPTTISEARERLGEWAEVWDKVVGHGPLPSLEELRRWRPKVTEAHISACLGEVANARTAGTVNAPRSLFFHRLKGTIGKPTPTAWSKAQVLAALRPATATSAPDLRRPDLQTPDVPPPFTETPEERKARLKVSRAAYEAMSAILKETSKND